MRPTGPQVAHSLIEWADTHQGDSDDPARVVIASTARQLAQEILDNPSTNRLRLLGLTMLGIERLPDEQWTGPIPTVDFGTDEVSRAIDALSTAWKRTTLHKLVALRTLAWNATMLSRAIELQQRDYHAAMLANNGGHSAGMLTTIHKASVDIVATPNQPHGESKP